VYPGGTVDQLTQRIMVHVVEALTVQRHGFGRDEIAQIIESLSLAPEPRKNAPGKAKTPRRGRSWWRHMFWLGATTVPRPSPARSR